MTNEPMWRERFRQRFELESQGCSECGGFELIDKTLERYPRSKYHCEYDLEKIESFIESELTSLGQAMVGAVPENKDFEPDYNSALWDTKVALTAELSKRGILAKE